MTTVDKNPGANQFDSELLKACTEAVYDDLKRQCTAIDRSAWGDRTEVYLDRGVVDARQLAREVLSLVQGALMA